MSRNVWMRSTVSKSVATEMFEVKTGRGVKMRKSAGVSKCAKQQTCQNAQIGMCVKMTDHASSNKP